MPLGVQTTFRAWSEATIRDDPVAGFRHEPGRRVVGVRVVSGRAVLSLERTSNAAGAIGPSESGAQEAATRILVVGDSFSEIQRRGTTWPALLQPELVDRIGEKLVEDGAEKSETQIAGHDIVMYTITDEHNPEKSYKVYYRIHDEHIISTDHALVMEDILTRFENPGEDNVASIPAYQTAMDRCQKAAGDVSPQIRWFVE